MKIESNESVFLKLALKNSVTRIVLDISASDAYDFCVLNEKKECTSAPQKYDKKEDSI